MAAARTGDPPDFRSSSRSHGEKTQILLHLSQRGTYYCAPPIIPGVSTADPKRGARQDTHFSSIHTSFMGLAPLLNLIAIRNFFALARVGRRETRDAGQAVLEERPLPKEPFCGCGQHLSR